MSSPQVDMLHREHPDLMLETDLAALVGKSRSTIKRWRTQGLLTPSFYRDLGKVRVHLYDEANVVEAKRLAATIKPGRKHNASKPAPIATPAP